MKIQLELDDEAVEALATAIAGKITVNGNGTTVVEEEDDFGGTSDKAKELTLTDMQEAVGAAVGKHGKDKVKAVVKKVSGAEKVGTIPAEKYQAVLDALAKIK